MTPLPVPHRSELDGVEVLRLDVPGPLRASLVFRAGSATATFRTQPVPHLLEHLVISSLPERRREVNGTTTAESLSFEVTGSPERVRETLHSLCAAIREPDLGRLAHEARVVDVEADGAGGSLSGIHAYLRCGLRGAGLEGVGAVPAAEMTGAQVRDFAARRLVRGNAVLVLTGPVPEGLHLDLPEGSRTVLESPTRADVRLPALVRAEAPLTALSIRTDDSPVAALTARLLRERAESRLRHELGISYSVDLDRLLLGPGRVQRVIAADGAGSSTQEIAAQLLETLRRLAQDGPADGELADDLEQLEDSLRDPSTHPDLALHWAEELLDGRPVLAGEQWLEAIRAISPEEVADVARRALGTVLLTVPEDAVVDAAPLRIPDRTEDEWALDEEVTGTVHARRLLTTAPRDLRVVHGEAGLSIRALGTATTFLADQLVGIARREGWLELIRADGRSQSLAAHTLRGGDELVRSIEERWGELVYTAPEED